MALSLQGWLNGLSASGVVISGCAIGLFCIYKSRKSNAKLLFYMGLLILCLGLTFLGNICDFLTIIFTGNNIDNSYGLVGILGWMWGIPAILIGMYIAAELLIPEKKWHIVGIYGVLGIIFELFLFLDTMGSFIFINPAKPGEDLIDEIAVVSSPVGIIAAIIFLSAFIFLGFGFLIKSIQSTEVIRKKFLFLSLGFIIWISCGAIESFIGPIITIFIVRIVMISSFWFMYLGLREEPEKIKKTPTKKEVKVEGDLFRISKRPDQITEEEVSISKEKKICLVCKGKAIGMTYICTECEAFYCVKCAQAISNLENSCWACDAPIDESKPVKPFKKEEEIEEIEISEKPQKKPKD